MYMGEAEGRRIGQPEHQGRVGVQAKNKTKKASQNELL